MKIVLLAPPSVEGYYTASLLVSVVLRHEDRIKAARY